MTDSIQRVIGINYLENNDEHFHPTATTIIKQLKSSGYVSTIANGT